MPSVVLEVKDMDSFLANLTGWQRLVLQGILSLQERAFSLSAVYEACAKSAQESFPGNAHVNAKIRQQLQQLRDVGVIEFVDDQGNYELLISTH